jgi:Holliday junction resolvase RusA-like endonuclease
MAKTQRPIIITVQGDPVPKGRPRFTKQGHTYTPAKTKSYEGLVKDAGMKAMEGAKPLEGPLSVKLIVCLPIPKSWSKKKRLEAERGELLPIGRPDIDNFIKAALDGLNAIAYADDSQVVKIRATKRYSATPRMIILVEQTGIMEI